MTVSLALSIDRSAYVLRLSITTEIASLNRPTTCPVAASPITRTWYVPAGMSVGSVSVSAVPATRNPPPPH